MSNEKAFGLFNALLNRTAEAAIFYLTKNGIIWRDLPDGFPPWQTVYWYFRKWSNDDTWILIANELTMLHRLKVDRKSIPTVAVIDSQSVKNSLTATDHIGFDGGKLIKAGPPVRPQAVSDGRYDGGAARAAICCGLTCVQPTFTTDRQALRFGSKLSLSIRCWMIWCYCMLIAHLVAILKSS